MSPDCSGEPKYMPPEDLNNIPSFINTSEKWSAKVCESDCTHKFSWLINDVAQYNLVVADREKITHYLAEDCLSCHGESRFFLKIFVIFLNKTINFYEFTYIYK